MPYGNQGSGSGNREGKSVRLTGLFRAKRPGLLVGSLKPEDMNKLIDKIKAAMAEKKGLTFFLWSNNDRNGPPASLSVDVAQDRPQGGARQGGYGSRPQRDNRSIGDDPFPPDGDDNNPF